MTFLKQVDQIYPEFFGQDRVDRDIPPVFPGKALTFYCIFFGHQQDIVTGKVQFVGGVVMMIRKSAGIAAYPVASDKIKKSIRIANTGNRVHWLVPEIAYLALFPAKQIDCYISLVAHGYFALGRNAVGHPAIHRFQARAKLAQWTSRQAKPVAKTTHSIYYGNFNRSAQGIMLQTIITDDDINIGIF
jgi:hypothetical protein